MQPAPCEEYKNTPKQHPPTPCTYLDIEIADFVVGFLDLFVDRDGHGGDRRELLGDGRGQLVDPGTKGEEFNLRRAPKKNGEKGEEKYKEERRRGR